MTTTLHKRGPGRPGRLVLPPVPAKDKATALRNRRIVASLKRKRNPLTQQAAAAKYNVSQPEVSVIARNPASGTVAD